MKTRTLRQLLLYNYRYIFAYATITVLGLFFLFWQLGEIGPGLSNGEITAAARHAHVSSILHLPVYVLHSSLQWASIHLLPINAWSLRLPDVLLAGFTVFFLYHLLKKWFGKSTALISAAIVISADWFLFIARLGTGSIEFSFWLAFALYSFTKLLMHKTIWLLPFSFAIAGLLFTPFGPYAILVLLISLFGYRVFRERLKETRLFTKIASAVIVFAALVAVGFATYHDSLFLKSLLGLQNLPSFTGYFGNVFANIIAPVAIIPNNNALLGPSGVFFVRFFEFIFILFGLIMLWRTRINRLNLVVLILTVVLVLVSGLSSGSRGGTLVLVPAAIFMTAGIRHLVHRWRRTFPNNPYARTIAYIPLGILFVCVVLQHYQSYFELWPSQTATAEVFSDDFALLKGELNQSQKTSEGCQVASTNANLRVLLIASKPACTPTFITPGLPTQPNQRFIVPPSYNVTPYQQAGNTIRPLVNATSAQNVRWLVIEPLHK